MELNDEVLCAYLDGELTPEQRVACEAALAADLGAEQRLARLKRADDQLRAAFALSAAGSGEADPLAAMILAAEPGQPFARSASVSTLRPQPRRAWYRERRVLMAMAAGVGSLALGLALIGRIGPQAAGGLAPTGALAALLDEVPSGAQGSADGRATRPVLSFKAADGRYCRVFEQDAPGGATQEGLACRDARGWIVLAQAAGHAAEEGLRPAGGSAEIDALMGRLGGSEALDGVQEQVLIGRHWQAAPR